MQPPKISVAVFLQIIIIYAFNSAIHLPPEIHKTIFIVHLATALSFKMKMKDIAPLTRFG